MIVNSHNGFDPLRRCLIGRCYPPEFFAIIDNPSVRRVMERIAQETEEDYQRIISILESFNVEVIRPEINSDNHFSQYMQYLPDGRRFYQKPPMQPRDDFLVVGNRLFMQRPFGPEYKDFYTTFWNSIDGEKYSSADYEILRTEHNVFVPPSITRIGKDLYFDGHDPLNQLGKFFPNYRCHNITTGGHHDGVFCPVRPGLIVSLYDVPTYQQSFPGWEVVYLPYPENDAFGAWTDLKFANKGKWYIEGEELNNDVTAWVNNWVDHWMGYVQETVFDVNMLVIDEHNVIVNNFNPIVFETFDRHGITAHTCNFRHKVFWDCGPHCLSLDLWRDGDCKDYFQNRSQ